MNAVFGNLTNHTDKDMHLTKVTGSMPGTEPLNVQRHLSQSSFSVRVRAAEVMQQLVDSVSA